MVKHRQQHIVDDLYLEYLVDEDLPPPRRWVSVWLKDGNRCIGDAIMAKDCDEAQVDSVAWVKKKLIQRQNNLQSALEMALAHIQRLRDERARITKYLETDVLI